MPCVWMFFVVLSRGGARGVRAAANRRDKHPPEQAAPRPCVRPWQSSRVVGAGRERLGLVSNLRLGRRRRLAEVEEALLRRIRHLPTTRGFGSACSEGAKHLRQLCCTPTSRTPPRHRQLPMHAALVRGCNDRRRAGASTPIPPTTRAAGGSTDLLNSPGGRGASAHHGDLGGPRHGDALHARHGRGRHKRRRKAAKKVGGGASAHKSQLLALGGQRAGGGAPNNGDERKHGYLRDWAGWGRSGEAVERQKGVPHASQGRMRWPLWLTQHLRIRRSRVLLKKV